MGKFKIGLQIDASFLLQLCKEKTSGVCIQKSQHHVVMHPIHLKNFSGSVKDLLNLGIARYDKKLGGILLGYQNIKLINKKGVIHNDSSGIHVDLEGDFFVFKPGIGREMKGIVNRKTNDFVGVLVYNTFNVAIPKPQNEDSWLGHEVQTGCEVLFQIQHVDTSLHLPYIRGEMLSIISTPEGNENSIKTTPPKKAKSNRIFFENAESPNEQEDTSVTIDSTEDLKKGKTKIKKKKEKHLNQEVEVLKKLKDSKKTKKRKLVESSVEDEQEENLPEHNPKQFKKKKSQI